jgi:hypothetical protein
MRSLTPLSVGLVVALLTAFQDGDSRKSRLIHEHLVASLAIRPRP